MKLFMIRHGQTYANLEKCYSGQMDTKLTEKGKQQSLEIVPILAEISFDRVYTSDLSRAVDTQQLAMPGVAATPLALLREYAIGTLAGQNIAEADAKYAPYNGDYTRFGGETTAMVCDRAREFLAMLEADPCERVAAFSHGGFINCVLRTMIGDINPSGIANNNCNIVVFEFHNGSWKLLCWNYGRDGIAEDSCSSSNVP